MGKAKRPYKPETELFNTKHHRQMQRNVEKLFSSNRKNNNEPDQTPHSGLWFLIILVGLVTLYILSTGRKG